MQPDDTVDSGPAAGLAAVRAALERRDYGDALTRLDLAGASALAGATGLRAQALWGCGRYDDALVEFEAAADSPAASADDFVRCAQALASLGEPARAAARLDARKRHDERSVQAEFLRALYALDLEPIAAAASRFESLAAEFPGAGELVIAAEALAIFTGRSKAQPRDFGRARANARWDAVLYQARHVPPARVFGTAASLLRHASSACTVHGTTAEFGVFHGRSLRQIAATTPGPVHGFDSFEGLPADWTANDPRGSYSTGGVLPRMPANVVLHRGWFEQTLPAYLAAHPGPLRFAHVDCDLYESTRTVLGAFADRLVPGTVLQFDDYLGAGDEGERRAFAELVAARGLSFEYLGFALLGREAALRIT
ncbi:MAG TPA: class I SAM-dependent methyltransferase [Candidatus Saccharimonadia bacterium]|nr:class I SAM-dependent methyltransferase [Candidatus Saccharimonadia bacterium]